MRYFLNLSYNGTPFHGWQRQPNAISVQETVEDALSTVFREDIPITAAGRTDTGVHARCMYAHLDIEPPFDTKKTISSLNRLVGKDIAIHSFIPVKPEAHARFDAESRTYRYYVSLKKTPFYYPFSFFIGNRLDVDKMNEAASSLLEIDDFTSFAKLHSDTKTNICNVSEAHWKYDEASDFLIFTISADRFLRNMVRAITGTLVDVGRGKVDIERFRAIIEAKDRCAAGTSMPACGLFLEKIVYPKETFLI